MNNEIQSLANGDFVVKPLDDPKAKEFWEKRERSLEEYRRQAMELWSDSCTTARTKNRAPLTKNQEEND